MSEDRNSSNIPVPPIDAELEVLLEAEHVRIIYKHAFFVFLTNVSASLILVYGMAEVVPMSSLVPWLAVMLFFNTTRYFLARRVLAIPLDAEKAVFWNRVYLIGVAVSGLLWGAAAYLFYVPDPPVHGMFVALILTAIGSASVAHLSFQRHAYPLFVVLVAAPLSFRLLQEGGALNTMLGSLVPFYFAMLYLLSSQIFRFTQMSLTSEIRSTKQAMDAFVEGEELFHSLAQITPDAVVMLDNDGKIKCWNPGAERLFGFSKEDTYGRAFYALSFAPRYRETVREKLSAILETGNSPLYPDPLRLEATHREGYEFTAELSLVAVERQDRWHAVGLIRAISGGAGNAQKSWPLKGAGDTLVGQRSAELVQLNEQLKHEIYERQRMEKKLEHLATRDTLTGLYNRNELERRIKKDMALAVRYEHPISFFLMDIDYFKRINDRHGHQAGDRVLRSLADTMNKSVRNTDYIARYGGEEFVVVLPETTISMAEEIAERLRNEVDDTAIEFDDSERLSITISVGVSAYPENGKVWTELIKAADSAMYAAKNHGRNRVCVAPRLS